MKKWHHLLSLGFLFVSCSHPSVPETNTSAVGLLYATHNLPHAVVHTILIPAQSDWVVTPALGIQLQNLPDIARQEKAIAAINGGFFDPKNQQTTSYIVREGQIVADPRTNERLVNNPKLAPYMEQILNRSEFRRYQCGKTIRYDITLHSEPNPEGCQLVVALGGGPRLLPQLGAVEEAFLDYANGQVIRDAIGSNRPNARSSVGITSEGNIILAMVAQKPESTTKSGLSLPELAEFLSTLGVEKAINLDGGSSSSLFFQGETIYGKLDTQGQPIKRPILSALLVHQRTQK